MPQGSGTRWGPTKPTQDKTAVVPETGAIPDRPANFKYVSAQLGTSDANQLQWDAESTSDVTTFEVQWSETGDFDGAWNHQTTVTNTGVANVYTIADQVANRYFRVRAINKGNESYWAGPVANRNPARTVTIKGYFRTPDLKPVSNGQVWMELSGSAAQFDVDYYTRVEATKINARYESETGFWEMKVPQSNTVGDRTGTFYFRGANSLENTDAKVLPDGSEEDVFYTKLVDA